MSSLLLKIIISCMWIAMSLSFGLRSPVQQFQLKNGPSLSLKRRLGLNLRQYGCSSSGCSSSGCSDTRSKAFQLVLVRHGESEWNKLNKFTGWYDCPLSGKDIFVCIIDISFDI